MHKPRKCTNTEWVYYGVKLKKYETQKNIVSSSFSLWGKQQETVLSTLQNDVQLTSKHLTEAFIMIGLNHASKVRPSWFNIAAFIVLIKCRGEHLVFE